MDFRHLIVTCLFSKLRLPFDNQKVKENYAIFTENIRSFSLFWEIKLHFLDNSLFISLLLLYYSACLRLVCCCWATVMMHKSDLMVTLVYY